MPLVMMIMDWNLWNYKQVPPSDVFCFHKFPWSWYLFTAIKILILILKSCSRIVHLCSHYYNSQFQGPQGVQRQVSWGDWHLESKGGKEKLWNSLGPFMMGQRLSFSFWPEEHSMHSLYQDFGAFWVLALCQALCCPLGSSTESEKEDLPSWDPKLTRSSQAKRGRL